MSLNIIYSFNKKGFEANYWANEISAASMPGITFIPFNHDSYLSTSEYLRAQLLDNCYYNRHEGLSKMYKDLISLILKTNANILVVDTCQPYHPDFLKTLNIFKVLRTTDGPLVAYDRDFAYLHAFDHILYHSPAYSRDLDMEQKLFYCGAKKVNFWPLASFDALCDPIKNENNILTSKRDIDIVFVGAFHLNKMPLIAKIKKTFGSKFKLYGLTNFKKNLYFNYKYNFPGWITPLNFEDYVPLYQRSKIGINIHNRGDYTVGSYRLFDLPANGVMQISDGGNYLNDFFNVGEEIESYHETNELIEKIKYYLNNDTERESIALNGFKRVNKDYKIQYLLRKLPKILNFEIN